MIACSEPRPHIFGKREGDATLSHLPPSLVYERVARSLDESEDERAELKEEEGEENRYVPSSSRSFLTGRGVVRL